MQENRPVFEQLVRHLKQHVAGWPASKEDILSTCSREADFGGEERSVCREMLPDRLYRSPADVIRTLREMSP